MALSPADLDAIARIVDQRIANRTKPIVERVEKHSGQYRELGPALTRKISDSQHDLEDRALGFEKLMLDSIAATRKEIAEVKASIPPAAQAASGAEAAAVAGAHASIAAKDKAKDAEDAADRAEKNSLAARVKSNQALIAIIVATVLQGAYHAWQQIAHTVTP